MKVVLCVACLVVAMAWCAASGKQSGYTPILLRLVPSMRFVAGEYALNTRDDTLIPQLECAYNPLNDPSVLPTDVTCHNTGVDSTGSVIWQCEGLLDEALEFDNTQVICEGYSSPGDEYVKSGSCSLRYTLKVADPQARNNDNRYHYHQPFQEELLDYMYF